MNSEKIKTTIKASYGAIAQKQSDSCCSEKACCETDLVSPMSLDYKAVEGYEPEADLALGCGIPTEIAQIQVGDTVVDLGSGAGNDVFIARSIVGETGRVIGIDMTPEMIQLAHKNQAKLGYQNVEFLQEEIENMQSLADETADVVISNCVMNLVPNKEKAFQEIFRVLKMGGHFSISDIVYTGSLPPKFLEIAEMYVGCVAGATEKGKYLGIVKEAGFKNIQSKKERVINIPDEVLATYLSPEEQAQVKTASFQVLSITLYADKVAEGACCESDGGSCCGSEVAPVLQIETTGEGGCC
ncbi:MAG: arsenite methyltransferase [Bacteroidota bacterium]